MIACTVSISTRAMCGNAYSLPFLAYYVLYPINEVDRLLWDVVKEVEIGTFVDVRDLINNL
jgi:hypothetical protein